MFKQIILPIIAVAAFIVFVGIFTQKKSSLNMTKIIPSASVLLNRSITINDKKIEVELASNTGSRAKGLGGRSSLDAGHGMLFVFDSKPTVASFWMKDMIIPIDIIWIKDGKVLKIDKNIPAPEPTISDDKLAVYSPGQPIDYVLEVSGGYSEANNIKEGDRVTLPSSIP